MVNENIGKDREGESIVVTGARAGRSCGSCVSEKG